MTTDALPKRITSVKIPSRSRPGLEHTVTLPTCTCERFAYTGKCPHINAVVYGETPLSAVVVPLPARRRRGAA